MVFSRWVDALELAGSLSQGRLKLLQKAGPSWIWCLAVSTSCFQCFHFQLHKNYETDSKSVFLSVLRFYIRGFYLSASLSNAFNNLAFSIVIPLEVMKVVEDFELPPSNSYLAARIRSVVFLLFSSRESLMKESILVQALHC